MSVNRVSRAMRPTTSAIVTLSGAMLVLAAGDANAQASQQLTLAFTGGLTVPISGFTTIAIALAVALVAWRALGGGRLARFWVLAIAAGGAALVAALPENDAAAIVPGITLNLATSPAAASIPPPGPSSLQVTANNTLGNSITITALTLTAGSYSIQTATVAQTQAPFATCTVGLVVPAGGSCLVFLATQAPPP